jgi:hypothetical protein
VLAFGALGLAGLHPTRAHADGSDQPPGAGERVVKIGPQAVVIVDDQGHARMYDDPAQQARACKSTADCWGKALGVFGFFFGATYEDVTSGVEGGSRVLERLPIEE